MYQKRMEYKSHCRNRQNIIDVIHPYTLKCRDNTIKQSHNKNYYNEGRHCNIKITRHNQNDYLLLYNPSKPKSQYNKIGFYASLCIIMPQQKYLSDSTTTLLTMKFRIRWYHFLAPPRKESWHEEPLKVKNDTFLRHFHNKIQTKGHNSAIVHPIRNL